jgi:hypothetical protein
MLALLSPVPSINIEFCSEQTHVKEPSSPFDNVAFIVDNNVDAYRSIHLLPPPVHSPKDRRVVGPTPPSGSKGLDAARFEALKLSSKNNCNTLKHGLRKEVAVRAHQSKQSEYLSSSPQAPPFCLALHNHFTTAGSCSIASGIDGGELPGVVREIHTGVYQVLAAPYLLWEFHKDVHHP